MKDRIKQIRKVKGLTQQEFAEKLGIKRNTIATYESGRNEPIDAVISLICREFNVNEDWLRTGEGDMFIELDTEIQLMDWAGKVLGGHDSKFKKRFVTMLMGLSDKEWDMLERKVKEFAKELEEDQSQD